MDAPIRKPFSEKSQVVIVGAGPAGMVLAYLLVTSGISVRVLERHMDFKREFRGEGIQPSVIAALEQLDLLQTLLDHGMAIPAEEARIYLDEKLVLTLGGLEGKSEDFGLILFQEGFLSFLDERMQSYDHYQIDMGFTVTDLEIVNGQVTAVCGRRKGSSQEERIGGELFVITSGRNTGLRKKAGIDVEVLEATFNIYWMKFDPKDQTGLIPNGFQAYLRDDSMFILYRTYDRRIQVAWGKRAWNPRELNDLEGMKRKLIAEAPAKYRALFEQQFSEQTEKQLLKVACDRMQRWRLPGALFLGDAAHTMSPVAGQGINLAIRDSIVAANHLIDAQRRGVAWDDALLEKIEAERRPEVDAMQRFQIGLGYMMLGASRWQSRLFFKYLMPVLSMLGIRQYFVRRVQGGVIDVALRFLPAELTFPKDTNGDQ